MDFLPSSDFKIRKLQFKCTLHVSGRIPKTNAILYDNCRAVEELKLFYILRPLTKLHVLLKHQ